MYLPDVFLLPTISELLPNGVVGLQSLDIFQVLSILKLTFAAYILLWGYKKEYSFIAAVIVSIVANGIYFPSWNIAFWAWGAYLAFYSLAMQKFRSYKEDIVDQANTLIMQINNIERFQPLSQVAYVQHLPCPPKPHFDKPLSLIKCLAFEETDVGGNYSQRPWEELHAETVRRLRDAVIGRKNYLVKVDDTAPKGTPSGSFSRRAYMCTLTWGEKYLARPLAAPTPVLKHALLSYAWLGKFPPTEDNTETVNINEANLQRANLRLSKLQGANLFKAKLQRANLFKANLQGANLEKANLQEAQLIKANLQEADLRWANLQVADLADADLQGAYLMGANLQKAKRLTAKQLVQAKTLYEAKLDPELERELREEYPDDAERLFEEPLEVKL